MDLKLGHYNKDGIEVVALKARSMSTRRRGSVSCSSIWSTRIITSSSSTWRRWSSLTPPVSGCWSVAKRVRAHDGSLDLVCTQERILKIFRITGLTKVFGIHSTVDDAIAAKKSEK